MAELLPAAGSTEQPSNGSKPGRHSRFSADKDLIVVREVAAAKAHVAGFGSFETFTYPGFGVRKRFEAAAAKANQNPSLKQKVSWKTVQDHYKRLQDQFDKSDTDDQKRSGLGGGEMGEMGELWMTMREARDDLEAQKDADKNAAKQKEADREKMGEQLARTATKRMKQGSEETEKEDEEEEDANGSGNSSAKKKRQKKKLGNDMAGDMERFGEHLRDAELATVSLERERFAFEREKYELERQDRQDDRKECQEDRDADRLERKDERERQAQLELDKFKLMMEAFAKK